MIGNNAQRVDENTKLSKKFPRNDNERRSRSLDRQNAIECNAEKSERKSLSARNRKVAVR